jgi:lipoyl(octanoyl) transferase
VHGDDEGQYTSVPHGFLIDMDGKRLYHAGDTALIMDMQLLRGMVDVALLPIGDNFTMGPDDAVRAVEFIEPRVVIPMHYDTWDVIAQDPEVVPFPRGPARRGRSAGARPRLRLLNGQPGVRWRLITGAGTAGSPPVTCGPHVGLPPGARGARNMAVDHALFESVKSGGAPVLRLYAWTPPCLSLGRNQHARGLYDEERLRRAGIDVVRRPTGGLAVLHDHELTYCVLAPAGLLGGPRATYQRINAALVDALRRLGAPAGLAPPGGRADPRGDAAQPCFQQPAEGEVVAHGRKLIGSAQRCEDQTVLQHGSILLGGSQTRILDFLAAGGPVTLRHEAHAVTLAEMLPQQPAWPNVLAAIVAGFDTVCGTRLAPGSLSREEELRLPGLEACYDDASWTWRR